MTTEAAGIAAQVLTMLVIAQFIPTKADTQYHWLVAAINAATATFAAFVIVVIVSSIIHDTEPTNLVRAMTFTAFMLTFSSIFISQVERAAEHYKPRKRDTKSSQ